MELVAPLINFNPEGQSLYASKYITNKKWVYMREEIVRSNSSRSRTGTFRITSGISKPCHCFIFIINDANISSQTANPFLQVYNTFSTIGNDKTLTSCHLVVSANNRFDESVSGCFEIRS